MFDGICNLCNRLVIFIIKRDTKASISFTNFQSEVGKTILNKHNILNSGYGTIVYLCSGVTYIKSNAISKIFKDLGGVCKLLYYLIILIPRPIRDYIYDRIAKNRYKLLGKKESCMVPTKDIKDRFIL